MSKKKCTVDEKSFENEHNADTFSQHYARQGTLRNVGPSPKMFGLPTPTSP
jgi:hypothetical protein